MTLVCYHSIWEDRVSYLGSLLILGFSSHTSQEEGTESRHQESHSNLSWNEFINPAGGCLPEGGQHKLRLSTLRATKLNGCLIPL